MMKFNRILLKLSGESLMGAQKYGIDVTRVESYARQIKEIAEMGIQIGIVIGGGNIFRGLMFSVWTSCTIISRARNLWKRLKM